ncbi:MAG: efflux RND transporter periplasmic adaptor subunit [Myxococcota bacterium]
MNEGTEAPPPGAGFMAIFRWILVFAMAGLAAFAWIHTRAPEPIAGPAPAKTRYVCPMHAEIVRDEPGTCPICGMSLVARAVEPAEHEHEAPGIELSSERMQRAGVRIGKVERRPLQTRMVASGALVPNEALEAAVEARFSGWIATLPAASTGQRVSKGEILATIDSPELVAAAQTLLAAKAWSGSGNAPLGDAPRQRLELLGLAKEDIDAIEKSGTVGRSFPIRAPIGGVIAEKGAVLGAYVQPGTRLFRVADLSLPWMIAEIPEATAARLSLGTKAEVKLAAYPDRSLPARVSFIYPEVDPSSRALRMRLELERLPKDITPRPGMVGEARIEVAEKIALAVPEESIVDGGAERYVFLATDAHRFAPQSVKLGQRAGGWVEILEGLEEGQEVVTSGTFLIDSESKLRSAVQGFGEHP